MNVTTWAGLAAVVVSAVAAVGTILNNRRQAQLQEAAQKAGTVSATATAQTEAQRVALEGLTTLVEQLEQRLATVQAELLSCHQQLAEVRTELTRERADKARLLEQVGHLELQYQEALQQLEDASARLAQLERRSAG